jgi:hypothetical protein
MVVFTLAIRMIAVYTLASSLQRERVAVNVLKQAACVCVATCVELARDSNSGMPAYQRQRKARLLQSRFTTTNSNVKVDWKLRSIW